MKEVKVEVIGPNPPCMRCHATKEVVEKVAEKLKSDGIVVRIEKANIMDKDVIQKYGLLVSPAVAINGIVRVMGRIPSEGEVAKILREAIK